MQTRRLKGAKHVIQWDRFVLNPRRGAAELADVSREEIVVPSYLDAMPGVKEQRHLRAYGLRGECTDGLGHLVAPLIGVTAD